MTPTDTTKESNMNTRIKYRKKPVVVEAAQWRNHHDLAEVGFYRHPPVDPFTGEISAADDSVLMGNLRHNETPKKFRRVTCDALMDDHGWIDTLEGGHTVCPGDWIITGVQGEFYPCKPHVFEATYEQVTS